MNVSAHFLELFDQNMTRVAGESEVDGHVGQIEVEKWSWSSDNKEIEDGSGRRTGSGSRIEPSIFSFSKGMCRGSIRLLQAMHEGYVFRKAAFHLYEELAGDPNSTGVFDLTVELTDVTVLKYSLDIDSGDDEVTLSETWELEYRSITFKYDDGALQSQAVRKPGSSQDSPASKVDNLLKDAANLDKSDRQAWIKKLGDLDSASASDTKKPGSL